MKLTSMLLSAAVVAAAASSAFAATTYTWKASPADANWNTTSINWTTNGTDAAWVNNKESPARSTEQWIGRVEGSGALKYMTQSHVTNSIAPSVDGTIKFESRCDISGDYEVVGNANGCSCLQVASGQSISNLTLKVEDFSTFDSNAVVDHYQILSAPDGYTGKFALPAEWPDNWGNTPIQAHISRRRNPWSLPFGREDTAGRFS